MFKTLASIVAVAAIGIGFGNFYLKRVPDMPELDLERWWADGVKPDQEDKSIRPFKIEFNDTVIYVTFFIYNNILFYFFSTLLTIFLLSCRFYQMSVCKNVVI